ncbi:MAG TPA: DUF1446 domain-containing protein, partial [Thermoanaerobacterales bacterium]|nr:DUF1446 domain-containing protein [Thermoanaerobacterales bacterium]
MRKIKIGSGAGFAGDRIEPAIELIEKENLDYIIFECLAERTIAIAQKQKLEDPNKGYNSLLEHKMKRVLLPCKSKNTKIITNMGSANPIAAVEKTVEIARKLKINNLKIAAVIGDDIFHLIDNFYDEPILEFDSRLADIKDKIISANVYCGSEGIVAALEDGADVIITGRVSDSSLTLAPLIYEFGWTAEKDPHKFGQGVVAGHLLECGGQVTGGYYANPGYKEVPGLGKLGFPFAEIDENGKLTISKVEDSGGIVTTATCKEQLLYEIHDPSQYITPDCIADFSKIELIQIDKDVVEIKNATVHGIPPTLKVSIGYRDGYIGEGEISYGGTNSLKLAQLAAKIVEERLNIVGAEFE